MDIVVGDKVKVIEKGTAYTGRVGVIYEVRDIRRMFRYAAYFGGNRSDWQPFRRNEIEKISIKIGEQLYLFEL